MIDEAILQQAENVRRDLAQNSGAGFDALVRFARDFAIDRSLRNRAILLKMELGAAPGAARREAAQDAALDLLDAIVRDADTADAEARARKAEREARLRRTRGRDIERRVVLCARELGYRYPRTGFHLRGVDLDLRQGEITGVVGENANGKTTLFRILVGELRHREGTLTYPALGSATPGAIDWAQVKRSIAYVPQSLDRWHGALEDNLRYAAAIKGVTGRANDLEVAYIVERMGLRDYLDRRWDELSGGFKLRFALARALVWKPRLLALDEPLANLDFRSQLVILRDVRDLANSFTNPIAVVLSSQHLHEVEAVADHILFLSQGRVVYNGPLSGVGADRDHNIYEIGCDLELSALRDALRHPDVRRVSFDGISNVVHANRAMESGDFLRLALDRGVTVRYFRDISCSVKQLFDMDPGA